MLGPKPEPPAISPDEEWVELGGLISVTASDNVRDAMRLAGDAAIAFQELVRAYRRTRDTASSAESGRNPGAEMETARTNAIRAIESAQTVMRDELDEL